MKFILQFIYCNHQVVAFCQPNYDFNQCVVYSNILQNEYPYYIDNCGLILHL